MKNLYLAISLVFALDAFASIEYVADPGSKPTQAEIIKNRSCFQELATNGCGDPGEDPKQFRSFMSNVFERLGEDCRAMMSKLYSKR